MIKSKRIIIVAHFLLYGAAHALTEYLLTKKIDHLLCIYLPLVSQRNTFIYEYERKRKKLMLKNKSVFKRLFPENIFDYFVDIYQTIKNIIFQPSFDLYVGYDPLNCLSGIILKKLGKVKKVIFYSIDFSPERFPNKIINYCYHALEIFCVKNADESWNVSPRIAEGREKFLHLSKKKFKQQVVPIGVWNSRIKKSSVKKKNNFKILFLGHLLKKQGVQIVLEAVASLKNKLPEVRFVIVGGGEYKKTLKKKVRELSLEKQVTFTGWIKDRKKIDTIMSECVIAVATYEPTKKQSSNFTYYADPTKLKDYLSAGLPIILTDVSYNAKEISEKKCGVLVQYDSKEIAQSLSFLLSDQERLAQYRKNTLEYAKTFDWSVIFQRVTI